MQIDRYTAEAAAKNWLNAKSGDTDHETVSEYINFDNSVHIFNFENGGFALIAADDASIPVLGYSFTGEFGKCGEKTNIKFWMDLYKKAIDEIRTEGLSNEETITEWKNVLNGNISKTEGKAVEPLLTSTWNQSPLYNMYCPLDGSSPSVVGCVATAIAQIMNYHKHPKTGKGSSSYTVLGQVLSVDYSLTRYNWDLMPDFLTETSSFEAQHEVAQISYHTGVSLEMDYSTEGSGATSENVPFALETYFKYGSDMSIEYIAGYTIASWKNMLIEQLDRRLPLYYSGSSSVAHAFVCDGYQDLDYYHFNFGWGGYCDGYYLLDNLNPGGLDLNNFQTAVVNIIPLMEDLIITRAMPDITTAESSFQIDLSEYFTSLSGDSLTYSVDPSSTYYGEYGGYSISNGILTIYKIDSGTYNIVLKAATLTDSNFDDFEITFYKDMISLNIWDIETTEDNSQVVLSQHFASLLGNVISYSIEPSSEINGLEYDITDGIITFKKLYEGISRILLRAYTPIDQIFDEFYVEFYQVLQSGFGKSFNFYFKEYLDVGNSTELNSMTRLSFSAYIKLNSTGIEQGIASKSNSYNTGWYLMIQSNNILKFSIKTQDGITRKIYSLRQLDPFQWYHLDVVFDGKNLAIYINGELDNYKTVYLEYSDILHDTDKNMTIGLANNVYLDGELDEVILWNEVISLDTIRKVMREKANVSMHGLVSCWTFDEGSSISVIDLAGINNGIFMNSEGFYTDSSAPVYYFTDTETPINSFLMGETITNSYFSIIQTIPLTGSINLLDPSTGEFIYTPGGNSPYAEVIRYTLTDSKVVTPEKILIINVEEPSGISSIQNPELFSLYQNYPNPFNPVTKIIFDLSKTANIKLSVFNLNGQLVSELVNSPMNAGRHTVDFNGSNLNSGIYYYTLDADGTVTTKKMVLTK